MGFVHCISTGTILNMSTCLLPVTRNLLLIIVLLLIMTCVAPSELEVENSTINSVTICWKKPSNTNAKQKNNTIYKISWLKNDVEIGNKTIAENTLVSKYPLKKCYVITGLDKKTTYSVRIVAMYNEKFGFGNTKEFSFTTKASPCDSVNCGSGYCHAEENGESHVCQCYLGYHGKYCTQYNPCISKPCNASVNQICVNTSYGSFECICKDDYIGENCTYRDPCLSEPCSGTGQQCEIVDQGRTYKCVACPEGKWGTRCDIDHPCFHHVCHNGAKCKLTLENQPYCDCLSGYSGANCINVSPCVSRPCQNGGKCRTRGVSGYQCDCQRKFKGQNCEIYNACWDNPCQNNGICTTELGKFTCTCPDKKFYGDTCQFPNPCLQNTCNGHGICQIMKKGDYNCKCHPGYEGKQCENKNPCFEANPCQHSGTCVHKGPNQFGCKCTEGYWGKTCQNYNACFQVPCLNSGVCMNTTKNGGYQCQCSDEFKGDVCEKENFCAKEYCKYDSECKFIDHQKIECICNTGYYGDRCDSFDQCTQSPCKNGATCQRTGHQQYHCVCLPGFSGKNCQNYDPCHAQPCVNGGQCVEDGIHVAVGIKKYRCICKESFKGDRCELTKPCFRNLCGLKYDCVEKGLNRFVCLPKDPKSLTSCGLKPCLHSGTCITSNGKPRCQCPQDYEGDYCERVTSPCKQSDACNNKGQCRSIKDKKGNVSYQCKCDKGYYGENCMWYDICVEEQCRNNGVCLTIKHDSKSNTFLCKCRRGYMGARCENQAEECKLNKCLNGGKCLVVGVNEHICECQKAFTGKNCEIQRKCAAVAVTTDYGYIQWPETKALTQSAVPCPFGGKGSTLGGIDAGYAFRECLIDDEQEEIKAVWDSDGDVSRCHIAPGKDYKSALEIMTALQTTTRNLKIDAKLITYASVVLNRILNQFTKESRELSKIHIEVVSKLMESPRSVMGQVSQSSQTILSDLETLANKFVMNASVPQIAFSSSNLQLRIVNINRDVARKDGYDFKIPTGAPSVYLPPALFRSEEQPIVFPSRRVAFIAFTTDVLFVPRDPSDEFKSANEQVIDILLKDEEYLRDLTNNPVRLTFASKQQLKAHTPLCAYWKHKNQHWSVEGVRTNITPDSNVTICEATHLSSFTIIMQAVSNDLRGSVDASVLPFVGSGLAIIAYSFTIITYCLFGTLRRESSGGVVINLASALLLLNISFVVAALKYRLADGPLCNAVALLSHFLILACLMWLTIDALFLYYFVTRGTMLNSGRAFLKCALAGWGMPLLIVGPTVILKVGKYGIRDIYCRITPELEATYFGALVTPSATIILAGLIFHLLSLKNVCCSGQTSPAGIRRAPDDSSRSHIFVMVVILSLFACTWIFAAVIFKAAPLTLYEYTFCILNVAQAWLLFASRCILLKEPRDAWKLFFSAGDVKPRHGSNNNVRSSDNNNRGLIYDDQALLRQTPEKVPMLMTSPSHTPIMPTINATNGGTLNNHVKDNTIMLPSPSPKRGMSNGGIVFGETSEIKEALSQQQRELNNGTLGGTMRPVAKNPPPAHKDQPDSWATQRITRADPYGTSYVSFKDNCIEPTPPANPDRESYV